MSKNRILVLFLVLALLLPMASVAQEEEHILGVGYPFTVPPEGHMNPFVSGTMLNLGVNSDLLHLPYGFYLWAENRYEPVLAEDWGFDGEESFWLKLKSDLKWSDDSPLTVQDVVDTFAISRIFGGTLFNYVDEITVEEDNVVRFNMYNPSSQVDRFVLTSSVYDSATFGEFAERARELFEAGKTEEDQEWADLRTEITEFRPENVLYSGPYTLNPENVTDAQMRLEWQPYSIYSDTVAWDSVIVWRGEEDISTPLVFSGDLMYSTNAYPAATIEEFIENPDIYVARVPLGYGSAMFINHGLEDFPLADLNVRKAIAHAVNREEAARGLGPAGKPVNWMVGFPEHLVESWLTDEDLARLDPYQYDLEEAEAYMEKAGYTRNDDGMWVDEEGEVLSFELTVPAEFAGFTVAAESVNIQLNDFGMDVALRLVPNAEHIPSVNEGNFEAAFRLWGTSRTHPQHAYYIGIQRRNYVDPGLEADGFRGIDFEMEEVEVNEEVYNLQELIEASAEGFDHEAQQKIVADLAYVFNQTLPIIPFVEELRNHPVNIAAVDGIPSPDDPIMRNSSSDNFFIWGVLNGTIVPAE